jgi:hypothetical protein
LDDSTKKVYPNNEDIEKMKKKIFDNYLPLEHISQISFVVDDTEVSYFLFEKNNFKFENILMKYNS